MYEYGSVAEVNAKNRICMQTSLAGERARERDGHRAGHIKKHLKRRLSPKCSFRFSFGFSFGFDFSVRLVCFVGFVGFAAQVVFSVCFYSFISAVTNY